MGTKNADTKNMFGGHPPLLIKYDGAKMRSYFKICKREVRIIFSNLFFLPSI